MIKVKFYIVDSPQAYLPSSLTWGTHTHTHDSIIIHRWQSIGLLGSVSAAQSHKQSEPHTRIRTPNFEHQCKDLFLRCPALSRLMSSTCEVNFETKSAEDDDKSSCNSRTAHCMFWENENYMFVQMGSTVVIGFEWKVITLSRYGMVPWPACNVRHVSITQFNFTDSLMLYWLK